MSSMYQNPGSNQGGGGGGDDWMGTYADTITLLMAFFVVLLSMSTMNKKKYDFMTEVISKGMNQSVVVVAEAEEMEADEDVISTFVAQPLPVLDQLSFLNTLADVIYEVRVDGAELIFPEKVLFVPNSSKIKDSAKPVLSATVAHLKGVDPNYFDIVIQGHTDAKSKLPKGFRSRWAFSAARAMSLRDKLEKAGVEREILYVSAFADTRPLAKGDSREANETNRRVVIRIIQRS